MALVPRNNNNQITTTALATVLGALDLSSARKAYDFAYKLLSRKGGKSSLERKLTMGRNKSGGAGVASRPSPQKQMVAHALQGKVRSAVASYAVRNPRRGKLGKVDTDQNGVRVHFRGDMLMGGEAADSNVKITLDCLGTANGAGTRDISTIVKQLSTMSTMYREFRFTRIKLAWVPSTGYTTVGAVAVGVDRDPRSDKAASVAEAMTAIPHLNPFVLTDVKEPATLVWVPQDSEDRRWRYTKVGNPARDVEFLSHGNILFASTAPAPTPPGSLFVEIWAEFRVPF